MCVVDLGPLPCVRACVACACAREQRQAKPIATKKSLATVRSVGLGLLGRGGKGFEWGAREGEGEGGGLRA